MSDMIYRQDAIDALGNEPELWEDPYSLSEDYSKGQREQWNDDREALLNLPSAQPEVIHCRECRHHHYESKDIPYCDRIDYGYGWKDNDFCSRAERRNDVPK